MAAKRCVFDGGFLIRRTQTQWRCGQCGLPYGKGLMQDKEAWHEFRRKAKLVLGIERLTKTDEEIRPMLGVLLSGVIMKER